MKVLLLVQCSGIFIASLRIRSKIWIINSTKLLAIVLGFAFPSSLPNWLTMLYCVFTLFSGGSKYQNWQEVNQWIKMLSSVCKWVLVFPCRVQRPPQMPNSFVINNPWTSSLNSWSSPSTPMGCKLGWGSGKREKPWLPLESGWEGTVLAGSSLFYPCKLVVHTYKKVFCSFRLRRPEMGIWKTLLLMDWIKTGFERPAEWRLHVLLSSNLVWGGKNQNLSSLPFPTHEAFLTRPPWVTYGSNCSADKIIW